MPKIMLAILIAVSALAQGCISRRPCGDPLPQTDVQTGGSSFQDEQFIWETWLYGPNNVKGVK